MTRIRGFSLIELLIVVAIIAVLAAIAVPAYSHYTFRSRRADGQQLLLTIANAEERYYATNNKYGALTDIGYSTSPTPSANQFYSATVLVPAGSSSQAYTATASPAGIQATDLCGALTVNSAGLKTPTPASASSNANGNCW